jgi:hypothetical protein
MTPTTQKPAACLNGCWPTPGARAAPACIDGPAAPGCFTMLKTLIIATMLLPRLAIAQQSQQLPQPRHRANGVPWVGWRAAATACRAPTRRRPLFPRTAGARPVGARAVVFAFAAGPRLRASWHHQQFQMIAKPDVEASAASGFYRAERRACSCDLRLASRSCGLCSRAVAVGRQRGGAA